jgi:hypothetical protein
LKGVPGRTASGPDRVVEIGDPSSNPRSRRVGDVSAIPQVGRRHPYEPHPRPLAQGTAWIFCKAAAVRRRHKSPKPIRSVVDENAVETVIGEPAPPPGTIRAEAPRRSRASTP